MNAPDGIGTMRGVSRKYQSTGIPLALGVVVYLGPLPFPEENRRSSDTKRDRIHELGQQSFDTGGLTMGVTVTGKFPGFPKNMLRFRERVAVGR